MKEIQIGYVYYDSSYLEGPVDVVVGKCGEDSYIVYNPIDSEQFTILPGDFIRYEYFRKPF